jgi:hypothetical protein
MGYLYLYYYHKSKVLHSFIQRGGELTCSLIVQQLMMYDGKGAWEERASSADNARPWADKRTRGGSILHNVRRGVSLTRRKR